jgi:GDP-L-fucose synthase
MKILITGGTGMVGSIFKQVITEHELILVGSSDYDLRSPFYAGKLLIDTEPDSIIHLAARVGGVSGNREFMADFFSDNILMNTNILSAANRLGIQKTVSLLSTCIYPDKVSYPLTEEQIHCGEPHSSNFGYAYAKRMLDVQSRTLRKQYNRNYVTVVPNNIYGPNDNFHLENSHVVPAMIRKIYEAKINKRPVSFWGSGDCLREFTFSEDIATILLWSLENYSGEHPLNIGNPGEYSIRYLAETLMKLMDYTGDVIWNTEKPEGQFRKPSSNEKFINLVGNYSYTPLEAGLRKTVNWFLKAYPDIRGF